MVDDKLSDVTSDDQARPSIPANYPVGWEADVLLSDGSTAHLRPIRPDDADRLVAFYARVSPESKYLRFFAPYPELSDADVKKFTEVDYDNRVALIITVGDDMVAVGRYDRLNESDARSPSWSRTTSRAAGWASCCWSTWPRRPANGT